ncbi:MAG: carbohydrate ABC transporter permease [FCB group bacterium]|jgi:multiple sugar transport system permease protein|nr:carbohydrate ABC transporter permease [FCB group bacterium]
MATSEYRHPFRVHWAAHLSLLLASALFILPFLWMLSTSLKPESRIFQKAGEAPQWIPSTDVRTVKGHNVVTYTGEDPALKGKSGVDFKTLDNEQHVLVIDGKEVKAWTEEFEIRQRIGFHWENYTQAFERMDFIQNLRNTLFICLTVVLGTVISSSLVAYSFSRIEWPGRDVLFVAVLATMMIPYEVTLIPLFVLYRNIGWTGTFLPLIVPAFFGVPFYIFLLRQFFMGIPQDLSAAARIDGCNEFAIFWRIILPLSKPALATTALFQFLFEWGDFLNPLIFLQDDRQYTLAIALQQFQSMHESAWGPLMAMSTVITIPVIVLFFLAQRTFIQGITMTGLKG